MMPTILQPLIPLINNYGYLAVGGFLILEDFGLPVPGETVLIAAAVYAGTGRLNVIVLFAVAVLCAAVGDSIGFAVGHYGGERLIIRYGRYMFLTARRQESARRFFNRYGPAVVIAARFVDGLRQLNGIIAGASDMLWRKFIISNVIGAVLWVGLWVGLGRLAGDNIGPIYRITTEYGAYVLILIIFSLAGLVCVNLWRKKHKT